VGLLAEILETAPRAFNVGIKPVTPTEDDSAIATLFGVPIGFQFGTAMGIENPIGALAVDILTDPITWLTGGLGGLTKIGRAIKTTRGLKSGARANQLGQAFEFAARAAERPDLAQAALKAGQAGDAIQLGKIGKELKAIKIPRSSRRLVSGKDRRDLINAFEQFDKIEDIPTTLAATRALQASQGQRALIQFTVPFTNVQKTIISGADIFKFGEKNISPIVKGAGKAFKAGVSALPGGKLSKELFKAAKSSRSGTTPALVQKQADDLIEGLKGADMPDYGENSFRNVADMRDGDISILTMRGDILSNELVAAIPDKKLRESIVDLAQSGNLDQLDDLTRAYVDTLEDFYKKAGEVLQQEGVLGEHLIEGYIGPQLWKNLTPEKAGALKRKLIKLQKKSRFALNRTFASFKAGEDVGLIPVSKDPAILLKAYVKNTGEAMANKRFLKNLRAGVDQGAKDLRMIQFVDELPPGAAARRIVDDLVKEGYVREERLGPVFYTHPSLKRDIDRLLKKGIFGEGDAVIAQAAFRTNMIAKASVLALSLFHFQSLTESGLAALGVKFIYELDHS